MFKDEAVARLGELADVIGSVHIKMESLIDELRKDIGLEPLVAAEPVEPMTPQIPEGSKRLLPFGARLSRDFKDSLLWIEDTIGLSAWNLTCCIGFETGMTFDPAIKNPGSSATGLIQFMDQTAKNLGTTVEALAKMTRVEQMNYVFKYFNDYRRRGHDLSKWNLGDTYMAILWPAGIGKGDDFPVFVRAKGRAYAVNAGLDQNKDGIVTRGECLVKIRNVEKLGMKELG